MYAVVPLLVLARLDLARALHLVLQRALVLLQQTVEPLELLERALELLGMGLRLGLGLGLGLGSGLGVGVGVGVGVRVRVSSP